MADTTFSADESRALVALLDTLLPARADGSLPGAGELGLARALQDALAKEPESRSLVASGLAALDEAAREQGARDFASLAPARRAEVTRAVAEGSPGLLPPLYFQACVSYYQEPRVLACLGLEPRPPHPRGYALEPGDLGPLERVRARGPLYRRP